MSGSSSLGVNFARVGTFTADGQGNITGGIEDANFPGVVVNLQNAITGGSYTVNADGRGSMTLLFTGGEVDLSITLTSPSNGYMVDVTVLNGSVAQTGSGNFVKQDTSAFALSGISGAYAFDFSGISPTSGNPLSMIGKFTVAADGSGNMTAAVADELELGLPLTRKAALGNSTFALDAAHSGSGRGTVTINGLNYAFYMVSSKQIKFMSIGSAGELLGDAVSQQSVAANASAMNGGFVFIVGGSILNGSATQPFAQAGRFTADGAGNLTTTFVDVNNNGAFTAVPSAAAGLTGSYQIDNDGSGHGTLTFQDTAGGTGTYTYGFYLISSTQAVFQNQSVIAATAAGEVADGSLSAQTGGPFSSSNLASTFAFSLSGVSSAEDDFVGQVSLANLNATGAMDFNEFGLDTIYFDIGVDGPITLNGDGTQANAQVFNLHSPATNKFNFAVFIANPNTVYVLGSDSNRVISGVYTAQTHP
jgi:hypothetical protein